MEDQPPELRPLATTRRIVASAVRIERAQTSAWTALRCTVGVAVPLVLSLVIRQPIVGVFGAVGALSVGFGSFQGLYRSRAATMIVAAVGMAVSIFVGSLAGLSPVLAVATVAFWGFATGFIVALGPAATFVGTQSAVAVIVAVGYPVDLRNALLRLALVLAGGLVQTILLVSIWPLRRYTAERRLVSEIYRSLADYAIGMRKGMAAPPEPSSLDEVEAAMHDPQPLARREDLLVFFALIDEAERIRASLAALALRRGVLAGREDTAAVRATDLLAAALAHVLDEIAAAVEDGREPAERAGQWDAIATAAESLEGRRAAVNALLGQVRAAWRTASVPTVPVKAGAELPVVLPPLRRRPLLQDSLNTLRSNFTLRSTAFRHALRVGLTVGIAMAVSEVYRIERGYWIALTALIVLRPEFHETFARGLARIAGTLAGAGFATIVTWAFDPSPTELVVLVLACVWAGYAVVRASYALFTVCITGYVVFLVVLAGVPEGTAAWDRVVATLAGGALALVVYGLWPSWEGRQTRELLADLLEGHREYLAELLEAYAGRQPFDAARFQHLRAAVRLARSNAEASIERLQGEPPGGQAMKPWTAIRLVAALRRYALATLALHADLERGAGRPGPGLLTLAGQLDMALEAMAVTLRTGRPLPEFPPLRATQQDLVAPGRGSIADETDLMVDSINTMGEILRTGER